MKPICLLLAAALSAGPAATAATRPHYGGTLRVEMRGTLSSFDSTGEANADRLALRDLIEDAVCDRLTNLNSLGEPQPSLATSWRSERDGRSWKFTLRANVLLHNGNALSQQTVITALSASNPSWRVRAEGPQVLIQSDTPVADLLYQLAEPQNSICLVGDKGQWIGSGAFQIGEFQAGQRIELRAFEDAWQGRAFLERIRIEMGKSLADQSADLQLGKADVVESDPAQPRSAGSAATSTSQPAELLALVFSANRPVGSDGKVREAIARAIDRNSIFSVLLRRQGEPNAALLPEWISGYDHLFDTGQDLATARRLRNEAGSVSPLSLAYDASDPLAKQVAERLEVNAREAGILLQPSPEAGPSRKADVDARLMRVRIQSPDPAAALAAIGETLGVAALRKAQAAASIEALYGIESEVLKDHSIIPIAHIPAAFSLAPAVHDWMITSWGTIDLADLWVEAAR